ncbi:MAG: carbon storage regulator CsrA [Spirochaetes bacterium]|nr:carbon storage regulator CsrA [Spirochaetota bacterium]
MLVLSRKINQSIVIGDNIEIVIIDIKGENIKVGIHAPKDVKVFRKEIYEEIERANKEAAARMDTEAIKNLGGFLKAGEIQKAGAAGEGGTVPKNEPDK